MKRIPGIVCLIALIKMELDKLDIEGPIIIGEGEEQIVKGDKLYRLVLDFLKLADKGGIPADEFEKIQEGDDTFSVNIDILLKAISARMTVIESIYPMEVHATWGKLVKSLEELKKEIKEFAFNIKGIAKIKKTK